MRLSRIKNLMAAPQDGQQGPPAASAVFSPPVWWVNADEDGWSAGEQSCSVKASVVVDGKDVGFETPLTIISHPPGVKATFNESKGCIDVTVKDYTDYVDYEGEVSVMMTAMHEGKFYTVTRSFSVAGKKKGDKGDVGDKGDDGVTYDIEPSVSAIQADKDGNVQTGAITVTAYRHEGDDERVPLPLNSVMGDGNVYWIQFRVDGGTWTFCSSAAGSTIATVASGNVSTVRTGLRLRLVRGKSAASYITIKELPDIPVIKDGQTGGPGKTGPWWYPAGVWDPSKMYERTEDTVPVVEHEGQYWYIAKENYIADGEEPTASSQTWKLMTNMQVVFAEVLFAAFAKLGSAVVNGDWMLSQYGTIEDFDGAAVESSSYQLFDPDVLQDDYTGADENSTDPLMSSTTSSTVYPISLVKDRLYTLSAEWESSEFSGSTASVVLYLAYSNGATTAVTARETPETTAYTAVSITVSASSKAGKKRFVAPLTGTYYVRGYRSGGEGSEEVSILNCRIARRKFVPRYFVDLLRGFSGLQQLSGWTKIPGKTICWDLLLTNSTSASSPNKGNIVVIPPNMSVTSTVDVWLDNPATNANKMAEIINRGMGTVNVRSVMPAGRSHAFKIDSTSGWGDTDYIRYTSPGTTGTNAERAATSLAYARFWSDGSYWYMLEWRTKDGKFRGLNY